MPMIKIDDLVWFAPNWGVWVEEAAADADPVRLRDAIRLAYSHMQDPMLLEACHGSRGPLAPYRNQEMTYEQYLELVATLERQQKQRAATASAKRQHIRLRRSDYSARRSQLILALIESGVPYICAHPECDEHVDLTVDHVEPISKGGSDDLTNLQFLCRRHNSKKGDRSNGRGGELT